MLPFSSGSFVRLLLSLFYMLEIGCLGMSFGITPHQLTRVTFSVVGSCFSLSWLLQSYIDLPFGLQNVFSVRSLGLRVDPKLGVPFRLRMQMFALMPWDVGGWLVHFLYLTGISLCIDRGFLFGSALWSRSFSSALSLLLFLSSWLACRNRRPAHDLSTTDDTLPLPPPHPLTPLYG